MAFCAAQIYPRHSRFSLNSIEMILTRLVPAPSLNHLSHELGYIPGILGISNLDEILRSVNKTWENIGELNRILHWFDTRPFKQWLHHLGSMIEVDSGVQQH